MKSKEEIEALALEFYPKKPDVERDYINAAKAEAFIKCYEMAKPKWISVKDELPESELDVLVRMPFIGLDDLFAVCNYSNGCWWDYRGSTLPHNGYVITHWMPLPEPPTK